MFRKLSILLGSVFIGVLSFPSFVEAAPPTSITNCLHEITSPGVYELQNDLTCIGNFAIRISGTSNVRIRLNGHTIDGDGTGEHGITTQGGPLQNIQITGPGKVQNFTGNGIEFLDVTRGRITKVIVSNNDNGIVVQSSSENVTVENNIVFGHTNRGIIVNTNSANNFIFNNEVFDNATGISVQIQSDNNIIQGNNASANGTNIFILGGGPMNQSIGNIVQNNIALGSSVEDIEANVVQNANTIIDNVCEISDPGEGCPDLANFEVMHF